jgi:hypothetical protein
MVEYYRRRVRKYEDIYEWTDPYRQKEQDASADYVLTR